MARDPLAPLLPADVFARRAGAFAGFGLRGVGLCLALGARGRPALAGLRWTDPVFNASMLLSGMGAAGPTPNDAAKVFAFLAGLAQAALPSPIAHPFVPRMPRALPLRMRGSDGG